MSHKIDLLKNLHKLFREDPYIKSLMEAAGTRLEDIDKNADGIGSEFWFDTMSTVGIAIMENQLDYKTMSETLEGKREEIEGRWKTSGKCDLKLLQRIADSWRNGAVAVTFTEAVIELTFISITGIPYNLDALKVIIEEAKPAHLPIRYNFTYRVWASLPPKKWEYYKKYTWREVMEKEGI